MIEKLQRVLWRLRAASPEGQKISNQELIKAIMIEIGTDKRTYVSNRKALIRLGWIKTINKGCIELTGIDLTDA